jgi:hypothetical protein
MPVWPKSFHLLQGSLWTAAQGRRLRRTDPAKAQARTLSGLLAQLSRGSHWARLGVRPGMPLKAFQAAVPLQRHVDLAGAIERVREGEADVLWPGTCELFALTSGTTGPRKLVPVTEALMRHFHHAGREALLHYTSRVRHAGVFRGRHLLLGASSTLSSVERKAPGARPAYAGELSGIVGLNLPRWFERHCYEPGTEVASLVDADTRLDATVRRLAGADLTLIAGLPSWTAVLVQRLLRHYSSPTRQLHHLQERWPNLECLVHTGLPAGPYLAELHEGLGPKVNFHEIYAATECLVAAQDGTAGRALRLMEDTGVYFEFVPVEAIDAPSPRALPLENVAVNVDYALVVTTPGGLARYILGDVVRFTSVSPRRLVLVGRTDQRMNALGENLSERDTTSALVAVCEHQGWRVSNFHVALMPAAGGKRARGRHEWWIELKPGSVITPTGAHMAGMLDTELRRLSHGYQQRRSAGTLEPPVVRLVMPGIFEHWLRFESRWGGQGRVPRCLPDRSIADALASITHFTDD